VFEIPSAATGDHGLEGFSVEVDGRRAGRVAAVNDAADGRVLVVDTGDSYRPVAARFLAQIDTVNRAVRLTRDGEEAFATAPAVHPRMQRTDTPRLVRHIPRELDRLMVAGERVASRHSALWYVGSALLLAGGVGLTAVPVVAVEANASAGWVWLAVGVPVAVLALGAAVLWTAMSRAGARRASVRERLADALSATLGITPRTRRRG
jgi:hypothetical protein